MRIAISAGHGWRSGTYDPGALNSKFRFRNYPTLTEHLVNSEIVRIIKSILKSQLGSDLISVESMGLEKKVEIINQLGVDLAIEFHLDSSEDKSLEGCKVLYNPSSEQGKNYANSIQKALCTGVSRRKDLGTREGYFRLDPSRGTLYFLRATKMPALIVESEFISSSKAASEFQDGFLVEKLAFDLSEVLWEIWKRS